MKEKSALWKNTSASDPSTFVEEVPISDCSRDTFMEEIAYDSHYSQYPLWPSYSGYCYHTLRVLNRYRLFPNRFVNTISFSNSWMTSCQSYLLRTRAWWLELIPDIISVCFKQLFGVDISGRKRVFLTDRVSCAQSLCFLELTMQISVKYWLYINNENVSPLETFFRRLIGIFALIPYIQRGGRRLKSRPTQRFMLGPGFQHLGTFAITWGYLSPHGSRMMWLVMKSRPK